MQALWVETQASLEAFMPVQQWPVAGFNKGLMIVLRLQKSCPALMQPKQLLEKEATRVLGTE